MTLALYKTIAAVLIFLVSIVTAIHPLKQKNSIKHSESIHLGEALASGIFLGAAFFHMLPDAINIFNHLYPDIHFPIPEMVCVIGFLLMLFLERLSFIHSAFQSKDSIPYILALILIIHAIIEGAALGMGATLSETLLLLVAILAHKGSESFALCVTMLRHQLPFKRVLLIILFFSLMTPLGISLGATLNLYAIHQNGELIAALFSAFAAGTFFYVSTLHHTHSHQHKEDAQGILEFASLVLGVAVMGVIAFWA